MSDVVVLSPAAVLLMDEAECDRVLLEQVEQDAENNTLGAIVSQSIRSGLLGVAINPLATFLTQEGRNELQYTLADAVVDEIHPALTDYARRGPRENDFVCHPSPGIRALLNQRERIAWGANRAMRHLGFNVRLIAELLTACISLGQLAADLAIASRTAVTTARAAARAARAAANTTRTATVETAAEATAATASQTAAGGATAAQNAVRAIELVELGAGDLEAARTAARRGVRVTAVDPLHPGPDAIRELEELGGTFVQGTAGDIAGESADQVVWYFPYPVEGTGGTFVRPGRFGPSFTLNAVEHASRICRPGGVMTMVTEHEGTALHLARRAVDNHLEVIVSRLPAGQAAPGAAGRGLANFSSDLEVFAVHIYKPATRQASQQIE